MSYLPFDFKKNRFFSIVLFLFLSSLVAQADTIPVAPLPIPEGLLRLKKAYPDFIEAVTTNELVLKDGTVMPYNDGILDKPIDTMLAHPDLEDMFKFRYAAGITARPSELDEAGRIRYEPFFAKMYGNSKNAVQDNLVIINWLPNLQRNHRVAISKVNGIAEKLKAISAELEALPSEYHKYLMPLGGAFNWRTIEGSSRRSLHSYGIAIDLNTKYSHYWEWEKYSKNGFNYRNQLPLEIVLIFEKYGFIWGGKWYHYDTMHFEYRPELL
jgi:peptidoglycan LD-endopeptidase CwlK